MEDDRDIHGGRGDHLVDLRDLEEDDHLLVELDLRVLRDLEEVAGV